MNSTIQEFLSSYFNSNKYTTSLVEILGSVGTDMELYIIEIKENKFLYGESDGTENSCYLQVILYEGNSVFEFTIGDYTQNMLVENTVNTEKIQKNLKREGVLHD